MVLDINRPEQKAQLERHADPLGVQTGDLANLAVTAAKLNAAAVTSTKLGPGASTLPKSDFTGMKVLAAAGKNGAGAITLTGTVIGDRLIAVFGAPTAGGTLAVKIPGTDFESTVTVTDQIQQIPATNLSANTYIFILIPAAA